MQHSKSRYALAILKRANVHAALFRNSGGSMLVGPAIAASCALMASPAAAQISVTTDIAGFNLSMTKAQAKAHALSQGGAKATVDLPETIETNGNKISTNAGLARDIRTPGLNPQPGDNPHFDSTIVLYNPMPNTTDIFALSRKVTYTQGDQMLHATLLNSLIQKYGHPLAVKTWGILQDETDYTWVSNPAAYDPKICGPDTHVYRPYFYEGVAGDLILGDAANQAGNALANMISGGMQRVVARARCGIILTVSITDKLGTHNQFVHEMRETLVDTGKGAADIGAFRSLVAAGANAAYQRQMNAARNNRPAL